MATASTSTLDSCIFCKIATGQDPSASILYRNERLCIFKDIRPASDFHFLAVPTHHVDGVKSLTVADKPLLEEMRAELENLLVSHQVDLGAVSFGFHIPPFTTVKHLHMHAIAPVGNMGFISRMIFKPNTMWFNTDEAVIRKLAPVSSD